MDAPSEPPAPPSPPLVIAFDSVGTLFSLASLEPLLAAAGGGGPALHLWFARLLADGFALTAAEEHRPFLEIADASLRTVLPGAEAAARDRVVAGLAELEPHPDSAPAMGMAVMDARVLVVTNAGTDSTAELLARGRLDAFVESVVSADQVQAWKPRPDVYTQAAALVGEPVERLAMVTAHPWDVLGAHKAGLVTGWCNREGATFPAAFGRPDVVGANLLEVVEGLFALGGGR